MDEYKLLNNAELRIKLQELEYKYEAVKNKVKENLDSLQQLNKEYLSAKEVLSKRTRGKL